MKRINSARVGTSDNLSHPGAEKERGVTGQRTLVAIVTVLSFVRCAFAAPSAERICRSTLVKTAGKYATCQRRAQARLTATGDLAKFGEVTRKCQRKYAVKWARLQGKTNLAATPCGQPRFHDNANGTLTDNLTGLIWEKKTNDASLRDVSNAYTWTATGTLSDGSAFTEFLASLNKEGECFAEQCDWRLPTRGELEMLLASAQPCTSPACVDPILGLNTPGYWSSTTLVPPQPEGQAWATQAGATGQTSVLADKAGSFPVRAVRGGL